MYVYKHKLYDMKLVTILPQLVLANEYRRILIRNKGLEILRSYNRALDVLEMSLKSTISSFYVN